MISIQQSDAVKWANEYDGPLFHALLCDPPYHLTTIVKRFGKEGSAPAKFGTDGVFARSSKGFMGKVWDGGDIAFQPETWYAFMQVLHSGAFGMAFASSRGWHRLAVAIEDAGFIIHPTIFGWLYGSGFPKATRIDTQIDKKAGKEREVVSVIERGSVEEAKERGSGYLSDPANRNNQSQFGYGTQEVTAPATDLAKAWSGHRYGLQALKPALEPIIVFQKPYEGRPVDCMIETGAGALNIDGGRIETEDSLIHGGSLVTNSGDTRTGKALGMFQDGTPNTFVQHPSGRWPSNFILEDEEAARALDEQSGISKGGFVRNRTNGARPFENNGKDTGYETVAEFNEPDGGASRFFFNVQEQIDESDPVYYCSKASKTERDEGLEDLPIHLFGQSGGAQSALAPGERTYQEGDNISTGLNTIKKRHNNHPTVKPMALSKYLATLLLPPEMYAPRRIFVPFAGVASECIGAHQAMWEEIVGIEMEKEYCEIAKARVDYWTSKPIQKEMF